MPKPKHKLKHRYTLVLRLGTGLGLLGAAAYAVQTHQHTVRASVAIARTASISWLMLSLLLLAITFALAGGIYGQLALHRLRFRQTILVELAAACLNRLLPSGLGGLGLHGVYLYRRNHTPAEATVVVSVNNLLGMVAHLALLTFVGLLDPAVLLRLRTGDAPVVRWQLVVCGLVVMLALLAIPFVRRKLRSFIANLAASVRKVQVINMFRAICLALLLTICYTLILYSASRSVGVELPLLQVFIVFSVGMLAGTVTPTPGGLVGAEAGLLAGFMAYGISASLAGASVLLFRLITYWLPLVPGATALILARRQKLV